MFFSVALIIGYQENRTGEVQYINYSVHHRLNRRFDKQSPIHAGSRGAGRGQ